MISPEDFVFFLDSGAYSAWSKGVVIDLDEYMAFIRANIERIEVYASLDVIPGAPGRAATNAEREEAAEASWANYLYMRADGLAPLPVYHYGEHPRFLQRMLDYGCDYIGIGGLVGVPGGARRAWLDRVFDQLAEHAATTGKPITKTHGFGMTAIPLIFRYPWHSVDSTTWIKITANGAVYLPAVRDGEFVFDEVPNVITVSTSNPKAMQDGKHYNSLPGSMKRLLDQWLQECGKTHAEVQESYRHRATVNVAYFKRVSEAKVQVPWVTRTTLRPVGLFA